MEEIIELSRYEWEQFAEWCEEIFDTSNWIITSFGTRVCNTGKNITVGYVFHTLKKYFAVTEYYNLYPARTK